MSVKESLTELLNKIPEEMDKPEENVFLSELIVGEGIGTEPYIYIMDELGNMKGKIVWNSLARKWTIVENVTSYSDNSYDNSAYLKVLENFPESEMREKYPAPETSQRVESVIK
jgi:hypothetical protein